MPSGIFSDPYQNTGYDDLLALFPADLWQDRASSGKQEYSNLGYALLGLILTEVHVTDFESLVSAKISEPHALSSITTQPAPGQAAMLKGFTGKPRKPWDLSRSIYVSAGGLWSTLGDLFAFTRIYLSQGDVREDPLWHRSDKGYYWDNGAVRDSVTMLVYDPRSSQLALSHGLGHTMNYMRKLATAAA